MFPGFQACLYTCPCSPQRPGRTLSQRASGEVFGFPRSPLPFALCRQTPSSNTAIGYARVRLVRGSQLDGSWPQSTGTDNLKSVRPDPQVRSSVENTNRG